MLQEEGFIYVMGLWLQTLSRGGLIQSSKEFINFSKDMEDEFNQFHGDYVDNKPFVMDRLITIIQKLI
uniref:Uncharacterized protein n=1 Tax=Lepeophtheirus salmonis TaxID=72036 RepID=A0A0K2V626_LEPSM